ncbi:MAG: hypothetical protein ACLQEI_04350 [Terriglobales bacterium]
MDPINKEREIDQWLESALSQYGKAEPRGGLESRVLANLRAERNRIASAHRWRWALGTAAALAVVMAVVWVGQRGREKNPARAAGAPTTIHRQAARVVSPPEPAALVNHPAREVTQGRRLHRPMRALAAARMPKLEQFPSPQPLSEQEKILVSYVTKYPEIAALVAQDQADSLKRDREEEAAEAAKDSVQ